MSWGDELLAELKRRRDARVLPPAPAPPERPRMNKTETRMAVRLEAERAVGTVLRFDFEALTLRLADRVRYTPDFFVVYPGHLGFVEVKGGYVREDARIKLAVAARVYPMFRFVLAQWKGGAWSESEVRP
jgi:hypothetical protein